MSSCSSKLSKDVVQAWGGMAQSGASDRANRDGEGGRTTRLADGSTCCESNVLEKEGGAHVGDLISMIE